MRKTIWTCWFQGREEAPELVRKCLQTWADRNPEWDLRVLDAHTVSRYIDLAAHIDLTRQTVTAASLSGILRVLVLHEYGGVWVDATTFCNAPLDDWLHLAANTGFFAFARPTEDSPLATWFLAAEPGNPLVASWAARVIRYWQGRELTREDSWLGGQFGELCTINKIASRAWQNVPRISADGPLAMETIGFYEDFDTVRSRIDWTVPVLKLTHRVNRNRLTKNCLLVRLLGLTGLESAVAPSPVQNPQAAERPVGLLKVKDKNLGDQIQIIATENLLRRAGLQPSFHVDRDDGISHPPPLPTDASPGIVLHGWHKKNASEWPPNSAYCPLYLGFHIAHEHVPSLISPAALKHYAAHGPVGCRDRYTLSLLRSRGLDAFLSNCLSITFPRRLPDPDRQTEVFVASHDRRILDYLPASIGPVTFVCHYSASEDYAENGRQATELLEAYRRRAKLVVTNLLHSALPAIAMGVPVVVFFPPDEWSYPLLEPEAVKSHLARFSTLSEFVRMYRPSEAALANWQGHTPDVSALKLKLLDTFFTMAERWGPLPSAQLGPIAPPLELPEGAAMTG